MADTIQKKVFFIHPTADVSPQAQIGSNTSIWHQAQIREDVRIGQNCIIGKGVYIDFGVTIGDNVKIQNGCFVYHGVSVEDGVFMGPGVILSNDKIPRAINIDGTLKKEADWQTGRILVKRGASLGAGSVILPDVVIGQFAMVGAGSVVSKDVPDHGMVMGNPARLVAFVCKCGAKVVEEIHFEKEVQALCSRCGEVVIINK
ncbi:MAG TPA: acyltransferase [Syntrophomonadaceae bacterium]|nr:acyltransferase [Syntrophomonadaceae bacterium]